MTTARRHSPLATLALGLSLWMALPSLEWCPFRWDDCTAACTDAEVVACGTPVEACEANAASACETTCPPPAAETAGACDPSPDPVPLGDRAYCVHPPVDALVVHPIELGPPDAAPLLAVLAPALALQPPLVEASPPTIPRFLPPPLADPHAPPLPRAPPVA